MTAVLKVLFSAATIGASVYSMSVFGPGLWSWTFLVLAGLVLLSIPLPRLDRLAISIGKVSGVLALLALALLFIAATTGGSFRVSDDNAAFGVLLAVMAVFGLSALKWQDRLRESITDRPPEDVGED